MDSIQAAKYALHRATVKRVMGCGGGFLDTLGERASRLCSLQLRGGAWRPLGGAAHEGTALPPGEPGEDGRAPAPAECQAAAAAAPAPAAAAPPAEASLAVRLLRQLSKELWDAAKASSVACNGGSASLPGAGGRGAGAWLHWPEGAARRSGAQGSEPDCGDGACTRGCGAAPQGGQGRHLTSPNLELVSIPEDDSAPATQPGVCSKPCLRFLRSVSDVSSLSAEATAATRFDSDKITRLSLRLDGMDDWGLLAALVTGFAMQLMSSVSAPDFAGSDLWVPPVLFVVFGMVATVSAFYAMMVFGLCNLYGRTALGLQKDDGYLRFITATAAYRENAFVALLTSIASIIATLSFMLFLKTPFLIALVSSAGALLLCCKGSCHLRAIMSCATRDIYS